MPVLSDFDLWNYIKSGRLKIIPFSREIVRENGLDLKIGRQIARFKKTGRIFKPGCKVEDFYEIEEIDSFIIHPHEHVLLHTEEYLEVPNDLMGFVNLRSVDYNERIYVIFDKDCELVKIGELVEEKPKIKALAFDFSDFKIKPFPVLDFIAHPAPEKMIKIATDSGKRAIITPSHSLFSIDKWLTPKPVIAGLLTKGDIVLSSRGDTKRLIDEERPFGEKEDQVIKINDNFQIGDLILDKISKIETVRPSTDQVYDLSVPPVENFIGESGIIFHNSTYARLGCFIPPTIIDAGFKGQLTIEMVGGEFPVELKAGERFLHVVFAKLTSPVQKPYKGKYQEQTGVKLPIL
ncbi:hypothetical protein DRN86_04285 [Candidatus Geothermarchaeota archaeon]|nr:MAG: hypothetical protein DRN86_04285 [Candidatus Geothermarchaeota archaeon]